MVVSILVVQLVMDAKTIVQQIANVHAPGDAIGIVLEVVKQHVWESVIQLANLNVKGRVLHKVLMCPNKILIITRTIHLIHHLLGVAVALIVAIHARLLVKMDVKQHVIALVKGIVKVVVKMSVILAVKVHVIKDVQVIAKVGVPVVVRVVAERPVLIPARPGVVQAV